MTLSYDDGSSHDRRLIEIMSRYGLKGTFNLISGSMNNGDWIIGADEAKTLYPDNGMEVACHGVRHLSLGEVDSAVALNDVIGDRIALEKILSTVVKGMAYANGNFNEAVADLLRSAGIEYCRTTVSTERFGLPADWVRWNPTCHHANPRLMELAKEFLETDQNRPYFWDNRPLLFYVWGHSYEFDRRNNWELIENFAKYIGGHDEVWYATNGEICAYVKAFDSLRYSVDCSIIQNPSSIDVWYLPVGKTDAVRIPAGETVVLPQE